METKSFQTVQTLEEFEAIQKEKEAILAYFSTVECSVCKVLKPKVIQLIENNFPKIETVFIEINQSPLLAAHHSVFVAPTIIVFFEGKEYIRKIRNFSLDELNAEIKRIYSRIF